MYGDRKGIAGFPLDGPLLLAILIALMLFIFTFQQLHSAQLEDGHDDLKRQIDDFTGTLRSDDLLTISEGVICSEKLSNMNESEMEKRFSTSELGFNYRIKFVDNSGYSEDQGRVLQTSEPPKDVDIYSRHTSIIIRDGQRNHLASMEVQIWSV